MPKPSTRQKPVPSEEPEVQVSGGISRRRFVTAAASITAGAILGVPAVALAGNAPKRQYRIHPAIGVARVGNADPSSFFIGPEAPGFGPLDIAGDAGTPSIPKKVNGRVKPQAARFRVWEYQMDSQGLWQPIQEVNLNTPGVLTVQWSAHLANKKSSFHQFGGPAGESTPSAGLRNASVTNRSSLETDFGGRSISGVSQGPAAFQITPGSKTDSFPKKPDGTPVISYLGQLRTDAEGRLLVIGGAGSAGFNTAANPGLPTYANNDNWFDDISDGPVTATVTIQNSDGTTSTINALGAWVLVAPPDFAPQVSNMVTMYDLLFDLAVRSIPVPANNGLYGPGGPLNRLTQLQKAYIPNQAYELPGVLANFDDEIQPILQRGYNYFFVDDAVPTKHGSLLDLTLGNTDPSYNANRQFIHNYMRPPVGNPGFGGKQSMPHILGDDAYNSHAPQAVQNLALTHTQYGLLTNWAYQSFIPSGNGATPSKAITPWGLDRAALENCVGGAFFPGIEASWQIRGVGLYLEPFRINPNATSQYYGESGIPIGPGHFSRQMAVPWHADFNDCRNEAVNGWWPGQRPQSVYDASNGNRIDWARPDGHYNGGGRSTHQDMVNNWYKYGFVVNDGTAFVESERNLGIQ